MPNDTRTTSILAALALLAATPAAAQQTVDLGPYLIADRAAEATLARSAAPNAISDSATVLVLTRQGFVEVAKGTNGFSCLVLRSFLGGVDDPGYWSPKVRAPHCFNPPAARTVLVETMARARWVMAGMSKTEIAARVKRSYASHAFPAPAPAAMAYMLSPRQYLSDADPHWMPHVMFYYDHSLPASAWGAGDMNAPIINASAGDPHGAVLTLFIPVRRWSDGTAAMTASGH